MAIALSFILHLVQYKLYFALSTVLWPQFFTISSKNNKGKNEKIHGGADTKAALGCHSVQDQVEWASRMVSNVHATVMFLVGMYIFFTSPEFYEEHEMVHVSEKANHYSALLYCFSNGYFLLDLYLVLRYMTDLSTIMHHVLIGASQWIIMCYWKGFIMGISITVTEITTAFVNQRWFFSKTGVHDWRYKLNGVLMFLGFLMFRVTYSGYLLIFLSYRNFWTILEFPIFFIIYYVIATVGMSLLNVFWFYKIACGLFKVLMSSGRSSSPEKKMPSGQQAIPVSDSDNDSDSTPQHARGNVRRRTRKE